MAGEHIRSSSGPSVCLSLESASAAYEADNEARKSARTYVSLTGVIISNHQLSSQQRLHSRPPPPPSASCSQA